MPTATYELPYEGAKEMLLVNDVDNREILCNLFLAIYDELPAPKKKKTTSQELRQKALSYEFQPTAKGFLIWILSPHKPPVNHSLTRKPLGFYDLAAYSHSIVPTGFGVRS